MNPPSETSPPRGYYHYAQPSSRKGSDLSLPTSGERKASGSSPVVSPTVPVKKSVSRSTSTKSASDIRLAPKAATSSKSLAIATENRTILHKFTIYETKTRLYVVGSNLSEDRFRILKVDRTSSSDLTLTADDVVYSKLECVDLLSRIDQGNKLAGGLTKVMSAFGLVGTVISFIFLPHAEVSFHSSIHFYPINVALLSRTIKKLSSFLAPVENYFNFYHIFPA